jgi:flagellar biosynthesis/type III secretory pathway M-ring protein FliF/YscJ
MNKSKTAYCFFHKASAVFMILALVWLTISTPFVCAFKQEMAQQAKKANAQSAIVLEEDNSNPLGNNTEEKTPSSPTSFNEEYLHHSESTHFLLSEGAKFYKPTNANTYTAYHGELLVPPPNAT